MNKLLLVDGNSIMNRAFYGLGRNNMLSTKDGIFTNAIFGFLNILDKFIAQDNPTHMCVAFDLKGKTFRHKIYKEYKAGRSETPAELIMQFPLIKEVLTAMNISYIELKGEEADDLIGTIKKISDDHDFETTVLTGDRDMIQLASVKTTVKIPTTKKGQNITNVFTDESLFELMNITADQFIDVKALMGDKSDNIPGVAGIGEKTALKLVTAYKSIDGIYENIDSIKSENIRNKLLTDKENTYLSYKLSKINCDLPLDIELSSYKNEPYNMELLLPLFEKLEFNYFIKKYKLADKNKGKLEYKFSTIDSLEKIKLESEITFFMIDDLFEFTFDGINCYQCKDFSLLPLLFENVTHINGHYLKSFIIYLLKHDLSVPIVSFDSATTAYLLDSTKDYYDLDEIFNQYSNYLNEDDSCSVIKIHHVKKSMLKKIEEEEMNELLYQIELPLIEVLAYLEYTGIKTDKSFLVDFSEKLAKKLETVQEEIFLLADEEFNLNSPKQLGVILFEKLKLPHGKKNKTGYSTSMSVLEKLAGEYYIADLIINYRKLSKLKSTYADGLIKCINEKDQRIHSNFKQTVASTGRLSSTEPNLQNLPIRSELGREIRKAFICEDSDYCLISADYSQIELRILSHIAKDEILIEAFTNHEDIHTKTASKVFGVDERMVTKDMRRTAKAVNFGIIYGISDFGLARDLKIPVQTSKLYIEQYLKQYKDVKKYMDFIIESAEKNGFVTTIFNRKRYIPELQSKSYMQREFGKRIALNTPIQGSAADIIKLAMNKVYFEMKEKKLKSRLILQIHDELVIETHKSEIEVVNNLINKSMKEAFQLLVPLDIDINMGETLFDTK